VLASRIAGPKFASPTGRLWKNALPFQMSSITATISTVRTIASRRAFISLELEALVTWIRRVADKALVTTLQRLINSCPKPINHVPPLTIDRGISPMPAAQLA
jgi:hypothetical protein